MDFRLSEADRAGQVDLTKSKESSPACANFQLPVIPCYSLFSLLTRFSLLDRGANRENREYQGITDWNQRRRVRKGTSYKALVLEIRMELAKHYLLDTKLTLQEIAYLLDYSQAAPLSRAFKLYFGVSPERFRHMQSVDQGSHL